MIEAGRLALHRARHTSAGADDLFTRHSVHEHRAECGRKIQQAADRLAAAERLRQFLLFRSAHRRQWFAPFGIHQRAGIVAEVR